MAQRPLIGTSPNQVSTNGMLGDLAFQDSNGAYIETIRGAVNLDKLDKEITDTAVDIFVYDTRKDSDGGAWRKRTQHTSWYNETLNTATRGSRREFPAVAVIVAESDTLTIYDGDDPDMPMWMVFEANTSNWATTAKFLSTVTINSVFALNGKLVVGGSHGVPEVDFIDESQINRGRPDLGSTPKIHKNSGTIALRNNGIGQVTADTGTVTVNIVTNDVAMTVLPNAPIDDATGLPIPTIAVATDGGVSVIRDDGNVVDYTFNGQGSTDGSKTFKVSFFGADIYMLLGFDGINPYVTYVEPIPSSDTVLPNSERKAGWGKIPSWLGRPISSFIGNIAAGSNTELNIYSETEQRSAGISTDFNTGWMQGDIKGAFLSDTDATNVTGTELITNGTFDSDTTGWSGSPTYALTVLSIDTNRLKVYGGAAQQQVTTVIGQQYLVVYTLDTTPGYPGGIYVGTGPTGTSSYSYFTTGSQTSGTYYYYFTATTTTAYITLFAWNAGTEYVFYDNVSISPVEEDRSVNNKGLQVFGTITKSAVATGAELVGYSGFSAGDYLTQPHNSDLDFGTDDFCFSIWCNLNTTSGTSSLFSYIDSSTSTPEIVARITSGGALDYYITNDNYGSFDTISYTYSFTAGTWNFVNAVRRGNTMLLYLNGEEVSSGSIVNATGNLQDTGTQLYVGHRGYRTLASGNNDNQFFRGNLALFRVSHSAPSAEQIKKIYEDEKVLFQENAACTLHGSSDAVTALAYDDSTNLLYAGTSSGRSDFQGLRRINNTTTAVTTAISASNGLVAEQ